MTSNISLDALQLAIERVAARIVNLGKELAAAEPSRVSYLQDTVLELRREKNELRKQETILLQANVPVSQEQAHSSAWKQQDSATDPKKGWLDSEPVKRQL
ncbi:hypothetical protein ABBQ38_013223 [Trebouxia sp. C0009 RCD-2024]